jgi:hypothetical protein
MTDDPANHTPPSGDGNHYDRKHLRVIPTPDVTQEVPSAPVDPTVMSSQDIAAMLRVEQPSAADDVAEASDAELSAQDQAPELDEQPEYQQLLSPPGDLDAYELTYADGSTTPVEPPKRGLFRRGDRDPPELDEQQLHEAIAATNVDVWAAHRAESPELTPEPEAPSRDQPDVVLPMTTPAVAQRRRAPHALLALLLALVIGIGVAAMELLGGGGGEAKVAHHPSKHHASHPTLTVTQPATTPTTATTPAVRKVRKHHKKHHTVKARKKAATQNSLAPARTTQTVVQTTPPVTTSTPPARSGTSDTSIKKSTSSSSSSKSSNGEGTSNGALPDVKQTQQAP